MTNMVDATGSSAYSYTVAGQLAGEDGPWTDDAVSYTYSTATRLRTGLNLLQPNSSPWVQSYSYDSAERLQSITSPAGSFGYGFDPVRQAMVNSLSLPNAAYITNSFDTVARLLGTVLKNSTNGVLNSHQYAYNLAGQRTYLTNTAGDYRNYIYDNAGQLTGAHGNESGGGGRWNEQFGYKYDPAGNLASRTNNDLAQAFAVNSLNELSTVSRTANMTVIGTTTSTATNVTVNALTALLYADTTFARTNVSLLNGTNSFVAVAQDALGRKDTNSVTCYLPATNQFTYDGNGNLLSDGNRSFAYDDENQLTSVWVTNGWRSDFVYDGKMRRRIRREYTWFSGAWLQTNEVHYIYDGNLVIQERDANNVPTLSYTRGRDLSGALQGAGGIGGLLAMSQGSGASLQHSFYHADGNGNITALINGKQAIVARYLYDPFGNILSKAGPLADANAYRFSSKELHTSSGLLYYGYRFYDPIQQRWLNRDPLAESGGLNLYAAFGNNPVASVDFDGRFAGAPVGFALLSETTVSSSTAITIGGSGATTVIVGGSCATVTATTGLTSGGTATTGLSLLSEVLAPFTYALAGGYLLGELAEVSRDAERNPTGVNGPPGQASAPLLPGYTLQGDEYRDPTTGDIYSLSKGLVRDKFGRPMGAVGVDCPDKKGADTAPASLNPAKINFSQRTVSANVEQYTSDMANGDWDWSKSGPLRVMEQDGQWVSYDNRRLMAAQNAKLDSVPVQIVQPGDPGPNGMTWAEAFNARFNHPWNVQAGGPVPPTGLSSQPTIFIRGGGN